jgi:hypothetical protein
MAHCGVVADKKKKEKKEGLFTLSFHSLLFSSLLLPFAIFLIHHSRLPSDKQLGLSFSQ